MIDPTSPIPIVDTYRGVGIHDCQPQSRIDGVVKPAIDRAMKLSSSKSLMDFAKDITEPPEARALAAAKLVARYQIAVDERKERPDFDIDMATYYATWLNRKKARSRTHYGNTFHTPNPPGQPGPVKREVPLTDEDFE